MDHKSRWRQKDTMILVAKNNSATKNRNCATQKDLVNSDWTSFSEQITLREKDFLHPSAICFKYAKCTLLNLQEFWPYQGQTRS